VRERVLDPLEMRVASFRPTAEVEAQLATAYTGEGFARMDQWLLHHRPGSHLYVSRAARWAYGRAARGRGVVDGRRVVPSASSSASSRAARCPLSRSRAELRPSGSMRSSRRGVIWFAHGGWMPGYHSALGYLPSVRGGYVLMTNEAWDLDAVLQIESELIAYVQRKAKAAAPVPRVELEPAELEALAGPTRSAITRSSSRARSRSERRPSSTWRGATFGSVALTAARRRPFPSGADVFAARIRPTRR